MEPSSPSENSGSRGFGDAISETLIGFARYCHARLNLLQFEAKEAGTDLAIRLVCFLVAGLFCVVCYLATLVGAIAWISISREWSWYVVTLVAAALHLLVAVILVAVGKRRFGRTPFRDSIAELKRDQEWLEEMRRKP
jgi:uncharacterized membrane protein YqjE